MFSSSTRAAGSRTRVICGLARGDLPVQFQWLKDGIALLSSRTASTSNSFLPAFHSNANMKLFDTSKNSAFKNSQIDRTSSMHAASAMTNKYDPDNVQITTIDAFSSLLTISSLGDEHTGNYTCVATNPAGSAQFTASLTVKGDFWQHICNVFTLLCQLLLSATIYLFCYLSCFLCSKRYVSSESFRHCVVIMNIST